jgi:hypothetical protein
LTLILRLRLRRLRLLLLVWRFLILLLLLRSCSCTEAQRQCQRRSPLRKKMEILCSCWVVPHDRVSLDLRYWQIHSLFPPCLPKPIGWQFFSVEMPQNCSFSYSNFLILGRIVPAQLFSPRRVL